MEEKKPIPIIDTGDLMFPEKMVKAFEEWGCFRMVNHVISMELMSEIKKVARSLMDLPMEMKMKNSNPKLIAKGYIPPNFGSPFYESLSLYDMISPRAINDFCSQLEISPRQREILAKYAFGVHDLAQLIGSKLVEGLGLGSTGRELFEWSYQLKMNKYNYGPESVGQTGAVMHTDSGFITILQDDEIVNGLETVDKMTGELVSVHPIPSSFFIIVGDVGKVWSNGRFYNVKHRVQCYKPIIRTSISLFVLAPKSGNVEAPAQLVDTENPRLHSPLDFEEYQKLRGSTRSATGEALEFFLRR